MLGPLAFITMRQQKNETTRLVPFGFRRNQELINDDLSAVREIAELSFPQHQGQRIGNAVAELETHGCVLTQQAVHEFKFRLVRAEVLQGDVSFARVVVRELQVTLSERSARYVFTGQ